MRWYPSVLSPLLCCTCLSAVFSLSSVAALTSPLQASQTQRLIAAIDKQDLTRVKALLAAGGNPNAKDASGVSALVHAASRGSVPICELLLQKGAAIDGSSEPKGNPLAMAVTRKHPEIVKLLLDHGADPNMPDADGKTPIFAAVDHETEMLTLLLAKGADPNAHDKKGATPLSTAQENNDSATVKELVAAGAEAPGLELLVAAMDHDLKTATALLDAHVKPDSPGVFGTTPLTLACLAGDLEMVRLLVAHGANVNSSTSSHSTPLLLAITADKTQVARFLLEKGADAKVVDDDGMTVLMMVGGGASVEFVRLLVEHGASVRAKGTTFSRSVLLIMAAHADASVLQYILEQGAQADINTKDTEGTTPLAEAAMNGNAGAVKLLLERGANPNIAGSDGGTPLHYVAHDFMRSEQAASFVPQSDVEKEKPRDYLAEDAAVVKLLVEHGAKLELRNKAGKTPMEMAQAAGCRPAIEALKQAATRPTVPGGK
jgi:ankyrin repeat protein